MTQVLPQEVQNNLTFSMLQVFLGQTLHQLDELLPANTLPLDDLLAVALLVFFGVKTLLVNDCPVVIYACRGGCV